MVITLGTVGGAAQNTVASTTLSVPFPATVTANQVAVLGVGVSGAVPTTPAGWTLWTGGNSNGVTPAQRIWTKAMAGTEGGTSLSVTTPSATSEGRIITYNGVDLNLHVDAVFGRFQSSTAVTAWTITGATTNFPGCCLVWAGSANAASGSFTNPTILGTWTKDVDVIATTPGFGMGHFIWSGAGPTGDLDLTHTSVRGCADAIALKPAGMGSVALPAHPRPTTSRVAVMRASTF